MPRRKSAPTKALPGKPGHRYLQVGNRFHIISVKILKEIRRMQHSTNLLVPRAPFQRLVHEILQKVKAENVEFGGDGVGSYLMQRAALEALQEAAEIYIVQIFEYAQMCASHAKRITVRPDDFSLVFAIKDSDDVYNH